MTNCSRDREQVRIRSQAQTQTDAVKFNVDRSADAAARADRAEPAAVADRGADPRRSAPESPAAFGLAQLKHDLLHRRAAGESERACR